MKKTFSIFTRPVPMWLFALWIAGGMSVAALAAVPLYTGSLSVPATGTNTENQLSASQCIGTDASKVEKSNSNCVQSLTGTANRVTVSGSTGAITLNGPQDIATSSSPTFASLTTTGVIYADGASGGLATGFHGGKTANALLLQSSTVTSASDVAFALYAASYNSTSSAVTFAKIQNASTVLADFRANGDLKMTGSIQGSSDGGSTQSYVGPAYTTAGAAVASTFHSTIIPTITTSASQNTGCPSHGTFTTSYCGSVTLSGASTFASMGSSSGVSGNTMPSFVCGGVPWQYYGTAHLFLGYNGSQGLVAIDDSQANVIFFINGAAQSQTGPIVCSGT